MTRNTPAVAGAASAAAATAAANGNVAAAASTAADRGDAGSAPQPLRRSTRTRRPVQPPFAPSFSGGGGGSTRTARSRGKAPVSSAEPASSEEEASHLDQVALGDGGLLRMYVHPCAAALMQFHAHLARTEVIGYMGGFTSDNGVVHVLEAFPAVCVASNVLSRQGRSAYREVEMDPESDVEVRGRIVGKGLNVVGWYHSHPDAAFTVEPSHVDIENQGNYQQYIFKGVPFVAAILAPYNADLPDYRGDMAAFYVGESGPMRIPYTIEYGHTDGVERHAYRNHLEGRPVPSEAMEGEAVNLIMFYSKFKQRVHLSKEWRPGVTFLEKIRACMQALLPRIPKPGEVEAGAANGVVNHSSTVDGGQGREDVNGKVGEGKASEGKASEGKAGGEEVEIVKVGLADGKKADAAATGTANSTADASKANAKKAGKGKAAKAKAEKADEEEEEEEEETKIEIERPDCGNVCMGPVSVDTVRVSNDILALLFSEVLRMADQAWEKPPEKKGKGKGAGGKKKKRKRYF